MADIDLVRFAVVVDGGTIPFGDRLTVGPSCEWNYSVPTFSALPTSAKQKTNSIGAESWRSPDIVPMTDEQIKEMKLKRQPDQKAISA